ncbi:hypothetical protein Zm00014a_012745 [Zea mays]|uniref:Uncharacterized protein n=2 Tax=Zea mays TaxID=4577 RepID=A0A1D6G114_MAIZE|nr:hypothetical protein ZEAMMB73_Zm00001d011535 [Zea mays]AQK97145.1 hypothetical protein ZEAMMB73_Zm00001d011535 [Zea mays]PWZ12238.1 hypothetical protein Zm00014a_012745 [Zea mays]
MGLSISYPPDDYLPAVEDDMGRLFIRSLSFDDMEAAADSPSYSPSALPPAFGSRKLIMEGSLGFFERREADSVQMQNVLSIRNPKPPDREACSSVSPGHENLHNSIDEAIMLKVLIKIISDMYHFHAHLWWEIEIQCGLNHPNVPR